MGIPDHVGPHIVVRTQRSEGLLQFLAQAQGLAIAPPIHNSPPLWSWFMQPVTVLPFPSAATLWLFLLLLLAVFGHVALTHVAGCDNWKVAASTLPVTLTFGPLFLNLTLGQNGPFLLCSVLLLAHALKDGSRNLRALAAAVWVVAVGAKAYPALWIGCLPLIRRWRTFIIAIALCLAAFGAVALWRPEASADYWLNFLPSRTQQFASGVGMDDQSLSGFLSRVGATRTYSFPGLAVQDRHEVVWSFPWSFPAQTIQCFSLALLLALGACLAFTWVRNNGKDPDGVLYSLALFALLLFPHMERYNHILALPAMAWLWRQGAPYRNLAIIAYALFGLSRLNHLWALLPSPIGPVASGFGLFAVVILTLGVSHSLVQQSSARHAADLA